MFSVCLFQGYREVVIGRVDNVDRRERDAPVPAGGAAAAGAQRRAARALARRLPAQEDRYAGRHARSTRMFSASPRVIIVL